MTNILFNTVDSFSAAIRSPLIYHWGNLAKQVNSTLCYCLCVSEGCVWNSLEPLRRMDSLPSSSSGTASHWIRAKSRRITRQAMPIPRKVAAAPVETKRALYRVIPGNAESPHPKRSMFCSSGQRQQCLGWIREWQMAISFIEWKTHTSR